MDEFDLSFLQEELNKTEKFLKENKNLPKRDQTLFSKLPKNHGHNITEIPKDLKEDLKVFSNQEQIPSKYSHPKERENLINRLISEHSQKRIQLESKLNLMTENFKIEDSKESSLKDSFSFDDNQYVQSNFVSNSDRLSFSRDAIQNIRVEDEKEEFLGENQINDPKAETIRFTKPLKWWEHDQPKIIKNNSITSEEKIDPDNFYNSDLYFNNNHSYSWNQHQLNESQSSVFQKPKNLIDFESLYDKDIKHNYLDVQKRNESDSEKTNEQDSLMNANVDKENYSQSNSDNEIHSLPLFDQFENKNVQKSLDINQNKYLKTKQDLQKEADIEFKTSYSFKPKLYTKQFNDVRSRYLNDVNKISSNNQLTDDLEDIEQDRNLNNERVESNTNLNKKVIPKSSHRIEELYQLHSQKLSQRQQQKKVNDKLELSSCTFKPQISKKASSHYRKSSPHTRNEEDSLEIESHTEADVTSRLYEEAEIRNSQRRWLAKEIEESRLSEYTFQPILNPKNSQYNKKFDNQKPIYERIYDIQKDKKQYMQQLKQNVDKEKVDLVFEPKINPHSKVIARKKLLGYGLDNSDIETTDSLAASIVLGFHSDIGSRLMNQGKVIERKKLNMLEEREAELSKFMETPSLSKGSAKIIEKNDLFNTPFDQRQKYYNEEQKRRDLDREKASQEEHSKLFKPHVDSRSEIILAKSRPEYLAESPNSRFKRMSEIESKLIESKRKQKEREIYGSLNFRPEIDPLSKALGRDSDINELSTNSRGQRAKEINRRKIESDLYADCTFQPKINDHSKKLLEESAADEAFFNIPESRQNLGDISHYGWAECPLDKIESIEKSFFQPTKNLRANTSRISFCEPEKLSRDIRLHMLEKEEKRRSELILKEIEELKECTFQPKTSGIDPNQIRKGNSMPVVVKGLNRYFELKDLSNKIRENAKKREDEVFSVKNADKYRRPESGTTIVKEFKFHSKERFSQKNSYFESHLENIPNNKAIQRNNIFMKHHSISNLRKPSDDEDKKNIEQLLDNP